MISDQSILWFTALWSLSKTHYPSLVLVQPRKTRPCLTERLLMGRKESNQTNKQTNTPVYFNMFCLLVLILYVPINSFSTVGIISCLIVLNHY